MASGARTYNANLGTDCQTGSRQWRRNEFESGEGGTAKVGAPIRIFFFVVPLQFLALKVQLDVLVRAFVMVSTISTLFGQFLVW